ncbi:MAG: DUF3303 family protein [Cyanobacteria bacterium SZAS-4]|nr:DUF3303 family protein [Cyanobacteria bacterium SZAS-4]
MQFMVIERFKNQDARAVYARFMEKGRMLPEGLIYVDSWVDTSYDRCFQVMECEDATLLQQWVLQWSDLAHFEIIPVVQSASAWKHFHD